MLLLLALCLIVWIISSIVPLPSPWLQVVGVALVLVLILGILGVIHLPAR